MPASPVVSTESTSPARNESPGTPELTEQSSASRVASTPSDLPHADEPTTSGQRTDRGAGEWTFYDGGRSPASATYQPLSADSYQIDFDVKCHSRECNGYVICTVETNRSACIQASPLAWKVVEEIEPIRSGETVHVSKVLPAELLFNQKVDLYLCIGGDPCKISRPIHRKISVGPK